MTLTHISSLESARKKNCHELDLHHVQKVGIKRFWYQEAGMTLTPISSLELGRKKLLMNPRYIVSTKYESKLFVLRRPK